MKIFTKKLISYTEVNAENWQQGIEIGSQLLISNGYVNNTYIDKLIMITNNLGPYYVIAPRIALLHIEPQSYMTENAISLTYFKNPIIFKDESRYHVNFCLALVAKDSESHLQLLQAVAQLFSQQKFLTELDNCHSTSELIKVIKKYDK